MSPKLEKMARAIEDAMASDDNHPHDLARAALLAIREPDEAMIEAYCQTHHRLGFHAWANASTVLPAAIDAILAEEPRP